MVSTPSRGAQASPVRGWCRLEWEGTAVWVHPDGPHWVVPNRRGDLVLTELERSGDPAAAARALARDAVLPEEAALAQVDLFLARFPRVESEPYGGRAGRLKLEALRECWLHVTNRCNLACTHCLFASSPEASLELDTARLLRVVDEAEDLGCRIFYLTGGEPLIHPGLPELLDRLARRDDTHTVLMTNALAVPRLREVLERLPRDRFHFQVSLDGPPEDHDRYRGEGAHDRLLRRVEELLAMGFPVSLAMTVGRSNVDHMAHPVEVAARLGVPSVHYLWYFVKGKGDRADLPPVERVFGGLRSAAETAARAGIEVDNVEILRSQVFSLPGTRFDLSNAGWQSVAVGPDGIVYPTAALVFERELAAGHVDDGLETAWREGEALERLRRATLVDDPAAMENPLRFLVGGGDVDHSWVAGRSFTGHDPWLELYNRTALWLMVSEAGPEDAVPFPALRARMGERLEVCGEEDAAVGLAHSNCVLSLPGKDGHTLAKEFYVSAAAEPLEDIANPVGYGEEVLEHVPEAARARSYGCGSPVLDAGLVEGETVVDLGCGAGVECFIAAQRVGPTGRVVGVDMLDEMLRLAREGARKVEAELGYGNVAFEKGLLEAIPLVDSSADVVLSNCVINLSVDKRRTFGEIRRVLRPGGRLVIADVVSDGPIPLEIRYNEKLRGECLGGAMRQEELLALLAECGFSGIRVLKRFPYRTVRGYRFFSLTYAAYRPSETERRSVIFRGPWAAVVTEDGTLVPRGATVELAVPGPFPEDDSVFLLDGEGAVTNVDLGAGCACFVPPSPAEERPAPPPRITDREGCMVCGEPLEYLAVAEEMACVYCGRTLPTSARCGKGHFVCDECHSRDALEVITSLCTALRETDMLVLFDRIRRHPAIPIHGPEYHALVPAVIVSVARASGLELEDSHVAMAVERGKTVPGGACAFLGACGGGLGVATAFSVILGANPYEGHRRHQLHDVTIRVLQRIGRYEAARCCQRDSWEALLAASELSEEVIGIRLAADEKLVCHQAGINRDCHREGCPFYPANVLRAGREGDGAGWSSAGMGLPTLPTLGPVKPTEGEPS